MLSVLQASIAIDDPLAWYAFALVVCSGLAGAVVIYRLRSTGKYAEQKEQIKRLKAQHERDQETIRASLFREVASREREVHYVKELVHARIELEKHRSRESA